MKTSLRTNPHQQGSILAYMLLLLIAMGVLASLGSYVSHTTRLANRRTDMIAAQQYAEAGAVIACLDLNKALTNRAGTLTSNLTTSATRAYTKVSELSTTQTNVYQRTITRPFTNQTVTAQIWLPASGLLTGAKVMTAATAGEVTQTATVNVMLTWGYPAAIISTSPGTTGTGTDKGTAENGNVVVDGNSSGPIVVDGNVGQAILANGRANVDPTYGHIPASAVSMTNYGSANAIPDYTTQGTANTLFDFARFIAAAEATTNSLNTTTHNNHFTNFTAFQAAANAAFATPAKALEGVVVVDITTTAAISASDFPNGINVRGTLFFNFGPGFGPTDKMINEAAMNVNAADLSHVVATNPATYTTGYPPVYYDNTKNPTNISITSKGFANFMPGEDLPGLMYSIGTLDMHGPVNVSGVCYTPGFMEIENKNNGQIQYFKGSLIMGHGIYYQNNSAATSIVSFDPFCLDSLATLGNAGKQVAVTYWQ